LAADVRWWVVCCVAGGGLHCPMGVDGPRKLKEVWCVLGAAFPAGEILHGPLAVVDERITSLVIATCDPKDAESVQRYEKTVSNIKELKSRRGKVIAIANENDTRTAQLADDFLPIPAAPELLLPLLEIAPLQLFAYHTAVLQGREVDRPRNLTKAVVTE